jgi:hypothetical protein
MTPINYLKYKKDFDLNVHVQVFKATIKTNGEMIDEKMANPFNFTLKEIALDGCNNYMRDHPNYRFSYLEQAFYR